MMLAFLACLTASGGVAEREPADAMMAEIRSMAAADGRRISASVLRAMREVPRHEFVPPPLRRDAYDNRPLPIGEDQTISQPYIVALMTEMLRPEPGHRVLEVGTGSGYQAAILSRLVAHVWSIEIVPSLARQSAERLKRLGHANVTVRQGDGYAGWAKHAPFDSIIVTAGAQHVPQPLVQQLKPGGRMVIPVGSRLWGQKLLLIEKRADGSIRKRSLGSVRFVPLTRERD